MSYKKLGLTDFEDIWLAEHVDYIEDGIISVETKVNNMTASATTGDTAAVKVTHTDDSYNLAFTLPKGDPYSLTDTDKTTIVNAVLEALPAAESATFGNV